MFPNFQRKIEHTGWESRRPPHLEQVNLVVGPICSEFEGWSGSEVAQGWGAGWLERAGLRQLE
jgi:hypothetical protein